MPISVERITADVTEIARLCGNDRTSFTPAWSAARDYLVRQLDSIGCKTRTDAAGNLHARPSAISWDAATWLSGSHLDTVANGGQYDGVVGVVAALEALRAAREDLKIAVPLEMVVWAGTEPTFGVGMLGSRAYVGDVDAATLAAMRNGEGASYIEAGAPYGVDPTRLATDKLRLTSVIGYVEVHIEEGLTMWGQDIPIACVTAVAGRRQYRCELQGTSTHAGSTAMLDRRDALAGAAEIIGAIEKLAHELGHESVATVAQIESWPNLINMIPGQTILTMDVRTASTLALATADQSIRRTIERIAQQRRLGLQLDLIDSIAPVELDGRICRKMHRAADAKAVEPVIDMASGAFHDAAILAPRVPAAMLFVPCEGGISHSPAENVRPRDIASAATVLLETVRDRRID